ncbi:MAG: ribbon-helix-helix protein, CopG family [Aeromicrobium sp.]|jgi:post-segregation antitoxin (ccd killing protein)|nr:ribbon-helix-helix protein, CopG family [Aeromicrobium sp.]
MARMVRKQIVIDPEQERALEAHAQALGVSQSALIRQAIDALLEDAAEQERRREAWEAIEEGWREAERRGIGSGSGGRAWTREELHERGRSD